VCVGGKVVVKAAELRVLAREMDFAFPAAVEAAAAMIGWCLRRAYEALCDAVCCSVLQCVTLCCGGGGRDDRLVSVGA